MLKLMWLFIQPFVGLAGGSSSLCLSLLSPPRAWVTLNHRRIYIDTDVGSAHWYCANVRRIKSSHNKVLTCQELHSDSLVDLCKEREQFFFFTTN